MVSITIAMELCYDIPDFSTSVSITMAMQFQLV